MSNYNIFHDAEIDSLSFKKEESSLLISGILDTKSTFIIKLKAVWWELSPFDIQNVIFELNEYEFINLPQYLLEEFELQKLIFENKKQLKILEIDASVGLRGCVVFEKIEIIVNGVTNGRVNEIA